MEYLQAIVISAGYLTLATASVLYYVRHRHTTQLRGRWLAGLAVMFGSLPWIIFYLPRTNAWTDPGFTQFWRQASRINHFVTIGALWFITWILRQYGNGK